MTKSKVSDAAIRRLPRYYRNLQEMEREGLVKTSSQQLSQRMGLTASQIRQDFNHFGGFGQQGFGYRITDLCSALARILGQEKERRYKTVIVGAGNMGRALGRYEGFRHEGVNTLAYFDNDPEVIGKDIGQLPVYPMEQMEEFIRQNRVEIAVITVPAASAQNVADRLCSAGVRGIWNFAPVDLTVADGVALESIHLSDSLLALTYRMNEETHLNEEIRKNMEKYSGKQR